MTDLEQQLAHFTGTERYYRVHPRLVVTDGVKFLANEAQCFWLLDVIYSYMSKVRGGFAIAHLTVKDGVGKFVLCGDMDEGKHINVFAKQRVDTDFPLPEIKLYVIEDDPAWVVLLPSEY